MNTKQISALGAIMLAGVASLGSVPKGKEYNQSHQPYFQTPTIKQYLQNNFPKTKEENIILRWNPNERMLILENMPARNWKISIGDDEGIPERDNITVTCPQKVYKELWRLYKKVIKSVKTEEDQEILREAGFELEDTKLRIYEFPANGWRTTIDDKDSDGEAESVSVSCIQNIEKKLDRLYREIESRIIE